MTLMCSVLILRSLWYTVQTPVLSFCVPFRHLCCGVNLWCTVIVSLSSCCCFVFMPVPVLFGIPHDAERALLCLFRSVAWSSVYRHMCQSPQYGCPYTFTMPEPLKLQSPGTLPVCSLWLPPSVSLRHIIVSEMGHSTFSSGSYFLGHSIFCGGYDLTRLTGY